MFVWTFSTKKMEKNTSKQARQGRRFTRRLYQWHRKISLVILIPVIMWTISGLMHPMMAHWFRPRIQNTFLKTPPVHQKAFQVTLREALQQNQLSAFKNFRIVQFLGHTYYQVKTGKHRFVYLNTQDGKLLKNGDKKYAEYLARYFLGDQESAIKSITLLTKYTKEYKFINRLLPVYKISFKRRDRMDLYIDTSSGRLGTFNTKGRKVFLWVFSVFHNFSFLDFNPVLRITLQIVLSSIIFLSALSGLVIYGLFWRRFRKIRPKDEQGILRKYHRQIGVAVSIVAFTFAFSGAYHAAMKYTPDNRNDFYVENTFTLQDLPKNNQVVFSGYPKGIQDLSLVKMPEGIFYQVTATNTKGVKNITYLHTVTGQALEQGDARYARFLVGKFHGKTEISMLQAEKVTRFGGEYGFINKRLPVQKIALDTPDHLTYYVETTTSRLAAKVVDAQRREGFSFAFLHKYHALDGLGKNIRDFVMALAALGVLVTSLFGIAVFIKK